MKKRAILVTGGAGFIGSHVNKMLRQAGYHTVVIDNLSTGSSSAVYYGDFFCGDIGNPEDLKNIFTSYKIDAVMHFASLIRVGESVSAPLLYYQNNVAKTLQLLESMLHNEVKKIVFSSSAAVYGIPHEIPIREDHPTNPINPYGETKRTVERILHDFYHAYGLQYSSLRYFNAAGGDPEGEIKNYNMKEQNLIPILLRSLLSPESSFTIYGTDYSTRDGTCIRDYIHIYDLGRAHLLALKALENNAPSSIYNLGNGEGYSVLEVVQAVEKVTGKKVRAIEGKRRLGDPPILIADSQKAEKSLNWTRRYPDIEEIIAHAWEAL